MNILQSYSGLSGNATESRRLATERLQLILYEVCPNQCSGHGQCGNSVCTCEEGTFTIHRYGAYGVYSLGFWTRCNFFVQNIIENLCKL